MDSPGPSGAASRRPVSQLTVWTNRLSLAILAIFYITVGVFLTVSPWTRIWTENSLLRSHPGLWALLRSQFTRGALSGLGLIDIWIGISATVHYRDPVE
ncbi:MAG TPA: hypothetical protein VG892_14565 [Terriglobales bacterium]|nr:hypothetical protein [Terriglobales bacterium]